MLYKQFCRTSMIVLTSCTVLLSGCGSTKQGQTEEGAPESTTESTMETVQESSSENTVESTTKTVQESMSESTSEGITENTSESTAESVKHYYYICGHDQDTLFLDDIEWITDGSDRAKELGLTEDDFPNGFYIFNLENAQEHAMINANCTFTVLDWTENSGIKEEKEVDVETFLQMLDEQLVFYQEIDEGLYGPPYIIEMDEKGITSIREQYVP